MEREYRETALSELSPSPNNPRKKFDKMDDLIASIREKGVIVPLLIRPNLAFDISGAFEIIAGERRYRAACEVAKENGGMEHYLIPAIVSEMSDDEAFEVMTIENLQREDLTELEEASCFRIYLERKGEDSIPQLAERLGINPQYIRRRVAVLGLPETVLQAWEDGALKYGHLEQFIRVNDVEKRDEFIEQALKWNSPVSQIKMYIDNMAPALKKALFDKKATNCTKCTRNSTVQKSLFGDEITDITGHCLDPACFKQNQNNWLLANWDKFKGKNDLKTIGFRFLGNISYSAYESIYKKPRKACLECENYVSIIEICGSISTKEACLDRKCYAKTYSREKGKVPSNERTDGGQPDMEAPRAAWHGEYFREEFYKTAIPEHYKEQDQAMYLRIQLLTLLASNSYDALLRFGNKYDPEGVTVPYPGSTSKHYSYERLWFFLINLKPPTYHAETELGKIAATLELSDTLTTMIRDTALGIVMDGSYGAGGTIGTSMRHQVAVSLGIDLAKEWRINRAYLYKKSISEIHTLAAKFGFWEDEKAQAFLYEQLGKKRGKFDSCKKDELIRIILESGIDLAGKVPDEILKTELLKFYKLEGGF